jgi:hypothetical protein
MNMGSPAGPFENTGDEDLVVFEMYPADRADPRPAASKAVHTASQMHKPVFPVERRKRRRFYQFPVVEPGGTDGAGLGRTGEGFAFGLFLAGTFPFFGEYSTFSASKGEEQGITEPEKGHSDNNQNQYFKV